MTDFQGLVAAVTGGGSGIGAAVADLLAVRGARVAVLDRLGHRPTRQDHRHRLRRPRPHHLHRIRRHRRP
ncbi:SDR family NAD(P)-dependent oxidoreductase, partial [Micromonospora wenchangensis]|uniref:SDR family NAD(P)-dependent oxidoreductase n=1 Tax=Micromonospora wenchangensis TaxID=1185415 RepID=UPI003414A853